MTLNEDSPPDEIFYLPEHQAEREASNAMRIAEFVGAAEQEQEPRHVMPK